MQEAVLTKKDFVSPQEVRWCSGCGDYSILNAIQKVSAELGIPKENFTTISGIGCSSRLPYYMNTFGFHTIHGRAPTVATGAKVANPNLFVWLITGDGDGLSIGGNHFIHAMRRNPDLNMLFFNNRIYGLTKGQYSPTSEKGKKTKSSPFGSIESPINPVSMALASEATFVARTVDSNPRHMAKVLKQAAEHKGISFVEIFQNCVIFNDKAHEEVIGRANRDDNTVSLEHGLPLKFGKEGNKGIRLNGLNLEAVTIGENGVEEKDLLVHDAHAKNSAYAYLLSQMAYPELPVPIGVFRDVDGKLPYDVEVEQQIEEVRKQSGGIPSLDSVLRGSDYWKVEDTGVTKVGSGTPSRDAVNAEMQVMKEAIQKEDRSDQDSLYKALSTPISEILSDYGFMDILTVGSHEPVVRVLHMLQDNPVGSIPVVDDSKVVGIVTERDLLLKVVNKQIDRESSPVAGIMSPKPELVSADLSVGQAMHQLEQVNFKHLFVDLGADGISRISVRGIMKFIYDSTHYFRKTKIV